MCPFGAVSPRTDDSPNWLRFVTLMLTLPSRRPGDKAEAPPKRGLAPSHRGGWGDESSIPELARLDRRQPSSLLDDDEPSALRDLLQYLIEMTQEYSVTIHLCHPSVRTRRSGAGRTIQLPAHLQLIGKSDDCRWVKAGQAEGDIGP